MLIPQRRPFARVPIEGILIQRRGPARELGPKLPHHIPRHARLGKDGILPLLHNGHAILARRDGILLQQHGLVEGSADGVVLGNPGVAPGVVVAPVLRVHVEGAVIERFDGEVGLEIHAFVAGVGVALLVVWDGGGGGGGEPAFVPQGDHVPAVEGLDVGGDVRGPFGNDGGVAARAAGFVTKFPAEDCRAGFVPVDDEFDVVFVGGLSGGVGVEVIVRTAVDVSVGVYAP